MTEDQGVQLCRPVTKEVWGVLQSLTEGPAAGLHLRVDVLHRLAGPAQRPQLLQDGALLLPVEEEGERPGVN